MQEFHSYYKYNPVLYKKEVGTWITFIKAYLDQNTLAVCADKAGISEGTAFFWRHKINYFINKSVLRDEIELDETVITDCKIGKESIKQKTKKRGMSNDKVKIAAAIDNHKNTIIKASVNGRITSAALLEVYTVLIKEGSTVTSDSLRSYHKFMKEMKVNWVKIPSGKKEKEGHTIEKVNHLHDTIKTFLAKFRGVSRKLLQGYLAYFNILRSHKHYYYDDEFESILSGLFSLLVR